MDRGQAAPGRRGQAPASGGVDRAMEHGDGTAGAGIGVAGRLEHLTEGGAGSAHGLTQGLEVPAMELFDSTEAVMTYTHDFLALSAIAIATGILVSAITRNRRLGLWALALVLVHFISDFVSGFEHFVHGSDSPSLGLDLYHNSLPAAIAIELIFSTVLLGLRVS